MFNIVSQFKGEEAKLKQKIVENSNLISEYKSKTSSKKNKKIELLDSICNVINAREVRQKWAIMQEVELLDLKTKSLNLDKSTAMANASDSVYEHTSKVTDVDVNSDTYVQWHENSEGLEFLNYPSHEIEDDIYLEFYLAKYGEIDQKSFDELQPYDLADLTYDILFANMSTRLCTASRFLRLELGFPNQENFLINVHQTFIKLKSGPKELQTPEEVSLLQSLKFAYRICFPLRKHKKEYVDSLSISEDDAAAFTSRADYIHNELIKMREEITSGHGRKEPVRFDAIMQAFEKRENRDVTLAELTRFFKGNNKSNDESKRKYASSTVSWFNSLAKRVGAGIYLEAIKTTRYRFRLNK